MQKYANKTDTFCQNQVFLYLCTAVNSNVPLDIMATYMKTIAPVDTLSGMFGKREHSMSGKAIIANVRLKKSQKNPRGKMYFSVLTRSTYGGGTEAQLAIQRKFTQVAAATHERMQNPTKLPQDQAAFAAQSKYITYYSFIWNLEWAAYEG